MGKKYCSLIAVLAFIGAVVAGFLTYSYYFPGAADVSVASQMIALYPEAP